MEMTGLRLEDEVVLLRPYAPNDVVTLYAAARESIAEVGRWLPWCHADYALEEAEAWIGGRKSAWVAGSEYSFAVIDRTSERMVGGCGLNQIEPQTLRANLGYWIRTTDSRRGYATRAARLLARWGVETLKLQRLEIVAAMGNIASQRVALKAGAMREGIARNRIRVGQVQHDAVIFSIVREDLLGKRDQIRLAAQQSE